MGTIKQGILGDISGKVGNVVGYHRNGKNHVRVKAEKVKNPRTKEQQAQRSKFTVALAFLKAVNPFIRMGYRNYAQGRSAYNVAMSYLMKRAVTERGEEAVLDFERAMVSIGFLMPATGASCTRSAEAMNFLWEDNSHCGNADGTDLVMLLVYNKEKEEAVYQTDAATRADGQATLPLPGEWKDDALVSYLSFCTADGEEVANSICLPQIA